MFVLHNSVQDLERAALEGCHVCTQIELLVVYGKRTSEWDDRSSRVFVKFGAAESPTRQRGGVPGTEFNARLTLAVSVRGMLLVNELTIAISS